MVIYIYYASITTSIVSVYANGAALRIGTCYVLGGYKFYYTTCNTPVCTCSDHWVMAFSTGVHYITCTFLAPYWEDPINCITYTYGTSGPILGTTGSVYEFSCCSFRYYNIGVTGSRACVVTCYKLVLCSSYGGVNIKCNWCMKRNIYCCYY